MLKIMQPYDNLKPGDRVKIEELAGESEGGQPKIKKRRSGVILAVYPKFVVVQLPKYRTSWLWHDLESGNVRILKAETARGGAA